MIRLHIHTLCPSRWSAPAALCRGAGHHSRSVDIVVGCDGLRSPGVRLSSVAPVHSSSVLKLLSTQTIPTRISFGPYLRSGLYFRCSEQHSWGQRGAHLVLAGWFQIPRTGPIAKSGRRNRGARPSPALSCSLSCRARGEGREHGRPRRNRGLFGGSVGKWIWFNCPLSRPGDSIPYVILPLSTYSKYCCSL